MAITTREHPFLRPYILNPIEAGAAYALYFFLRALPVDWTSGAVGWLCRKVGPRLGISNRARRNLRAALPEIGDAARENLVAAIWEHLGRFIGEFPHLEKFGPNDGRCELRGGAILEKLKQRGGPVLFFSGHIGNYEILPNTLAAHGLQVDWVYRMPNNPLTDGLIRRSRAATGVKLLPKGARGARDLVKQLNAGEMIGLIVDQKMNDGIAVPFFGRDAMTAPALAQLALRYDCPIVPMRVERLDGAHFRLTIEEPLAVEPGDDKNAAVLATMTRVNRILEGWIRERPEQWLWLHNRWPS
jgi:KDO2-lipid IV(A) lauroyltransferase